MITKRKATATDTEFAKKVHHEAYRDVVVKQFGKWDEKMQDGYFFKSWNPETHEIILSDETPTGYCYIEQKPEYIYVHELVLLPEFQGNRIGSKILKDAIQKARVKNVPIKLQVLKENKAPYLYRKLGFKDTGTTDTHIQMEIKPIN